MIFFHMCRLVVKQGVKFKQNEYILFITNRLNITKKMKTKEKITLQILCLQYSKTYDITVVEQK